MPTQAAQALRDERLLDLASSCHPRTLRQLRWTNTMIKVLAPQLLTGVSRTSSAFQERKPQLRGVVSGRR